MKTFEQFILNEAGADKERQERAFIAAITEAYTNNSNQPIMLMTKSTTLTKIVRAYKFTSNYSKEDYTDVVIDTEDKQYNISLKGLKAPSLAGGGLTGIELIIPDLGKKFLTAVLQSHLSAGLKPGDKVPDRFAILNDKDKLKLVKGTVQMGGPIDYMFIGPMDNLVESFKDGVLKLKGDLIEATSYAASHDLYFRMRARRVDQTFDPTAKNKDGSPRIYGKSAARPSESGGRIVITDTKPTDATKIITL